MTRVTVSKMVIHVYFLLKKSSIGCLYLVIIYMIITTVKRKTSRKLSKIQLLSKNIQLIIYIQYQPQTRLHLHFSIILISLHSMSLNQVKYHQQASVKSHHLTYILTLWDPMMWSAVWRELQ